MWSVSGIGESEWGSREKAQEPLKSEPVLPLGSFLQDGSFGSSGNDQTINQDAAGDKKRDEKGTRTDQKRFFLTGLKTFLVADNHLANESIHLRTPLKHVEEYISFSSKLRKQVFG